MIDDRPWVGLLIGLAAMVPFSVQASVFVRNQWRHRSWVPTVAVVLHTKSSTTSEGITTHRASYNYMDPHGTTRSGRGEVDRPAANGDQVAILYDPADPARSQPGRRVHVGHWIAGGLGFLLFAVGVFGVVQSISVMLTGSRLGG